MDNPEIIGNEAAIKAIKEMISMLQEWTTIALNQNNENEAKEYAYQEKALVYAVTSLEARQRFLARLEGA